MGGNGEKALLRVKKAVIGEIFCRQERTSGIKRVPTNEDEKRCYVTTLFTCFYELLRVHVCGGADDQHHQKEKTERTSQAPFYCV